MKLNSDLLPYQEKAVNQLKTLKVGALFMEQGCGKTLTTLELARIRFEAGKIDRIIWLCPYSAKINIKNEILRQCPPELASIVVICGIETLSSSVRANAYLRQLANRNCCFLVVDESLLIKNFHANRTQNILEIAQKCPYRIILNGTPISKNAADLFAQFYLLDWRILGYRSYWSFSANHLEFDEYCQVRNVLNIEYLAEKVAPYTFQILKKDCVNLPSKHYYSKGFSLTDEQNDEYERVSEILIQGIDEKEPQTIYRLFSGLQAVISGKKLVFQSYKHFKTEEFFDHPAKNPRIQKLLEILPDSKAIIFCRYESEISQLCSLLPESVRFDGKIPQKERENALKEFRAQKKYLIANKNCAGFSLNLQFCHNIIYLSNDWDLGTRLQSEDRIHRLGQEHEVSITDIYAYNTLDEQILHSLYKKEYILDSLKQDILKNEKSFKSEIKNIIYGRRKQHTIIDVSELED